MPTDADHPTVTGKLDPEERRTLTIPSTGTVETRPNGKDVIYHSVPSNEASNATAAVWRILLRFGRTGPFIPAGLDVYGDTVIGRGSGERESPDIDLTNLGALEHGVSRVHALLHPTHEKLLLIDLNSTNGTFINAIRLSKGIAQEIKNQDEVAFAGLACEVKIVTSPVAAARPAPAEAARPVLEPAAVPRKPRVGMETIVGVRLEYPPKPEDPAPKR